MAKLKDSRELYLRITKLWRLGVCQLVDDDTKLEKRGVALAYHLSLLPKLKLKLRNKLFIHLTEG